MDVREILVLLLWLAVSMISGGSAIKNIKTDHPYTAGLDIGFFIYWTVRFIPLFLKV